MKHQPEGVSHDRLRFSHVISRVHVVITTEKYMIDLMKEVPCHMWKSFTCERKKISWLNVTTCALHVHGINILYNLRVIYSILTLVKIPSDGNIMCLSPKFVNTKYRKIEDKRRNNLCEKRKLFFFLRRNNWLQIYSCK